MNKEQGNSQKEKQFNLLNNFFHLHKDTLFAAIVLGILGFIFSSIIAFRAHTLELYDRLSAQLRDFVFTDEGLYAFCASNGKSIDVSSSKISDSIRDVELLNVNFIIAKKFADLFDTEQALGIFLSKKNFDKLHQFTYWNNAILSSEKGICGSGLLANITALDNWRVMIGGSIAEERAVHAGRIRASRDYLQSIIMNTEAHYKSMPVDLNNLPISQDMVFNRKDKKG